MKALRLLLVLGLGACAALPRASESAAERAARVYRDAIVIDAHNDLPTRILEERYDPAVRHQAGFPPEHGDSDVPRLLESGLTAQFFSAWVDAPYAFTSPDSSFERAMESIDTIHAMVRRAAPRMFLATTAADVRRAKAERRVAAFIGVEGGHAIEGSLDRLRELHARGARYMTLTWNNGNSWAGSSIGVSRTRRGGLTPFGSEVVREMERLGMLVDISHVSDSTFADVLAIATRPVIASHSSARALAAHPRNLTDDQLRAVARNGGVVNVNFYSLFLDRRYAAARDSIDRVLDADSTASPGDLAARRERAIQRLPRPPLAVLIDHIEHVARVAGIDHVGLGSDFDGVGGQLPAGMEDVTRLPAIAAALLARDWSEDDVRKVLGGNMLRVMEQVLR